MIVTCQNCGAHNRITDSIEPGKRYRCGKCKAWLTVVPPIPETKKQRVPRPQIAIEKDKKKPTVLRKVLGILSWVHPLLFALFPVLYLYSQNLAEVTPSEIVATLLASLGLGVSMFVLFLLIVAVIQKARMRSKMNPRIEIWAFEKVAIITSIFLILFFNYGDALDLFAGQKNPEQIRFTLAVIWISLFLILSFFVIRTHWSLGNLMIFMVIISGILVIMPTINIITHEIRFGGHNVKTTEIAGNSTGVSLDTATLPDIYYIIPDRYGSESALEQNFQFDNSEFVDYLIDKGFHVATSSHSNYARTFASLASSLNMEYIDYLTDELGEDFRANYPMGQLIQDNKVLRFLQSMGYKYINCGDEWDGTRWNDNADVNYNLYVEPDFSLPEFSLLFFRKTLAYPFFLQFNVVDDDRIMHRKNTLYLFDKLSEMPDIDCPTFTFAHLRLPHDPYVFHSDGSYKTLSEEQQNSLRDNYIDQLNFANDKLRALIDGLIADSEVPPIIILQSDEGPFTVSEPWLGEKATQSGLEIKMGILNAYYLPGVDSNLLYSSITPVNSFRLVFDQYFGTDFGLLDDKCYAYDEGYPEKFTYRFLDVTDKLNQN